MNRERLKRILGQVPTHALVILTVSIWIIPTVGLMVTSFRPLQDINTTGWWTALLNHSGSAAYDKYCAACHGADGKRLPQADLTNPTTIAPISRSLQLLANLRKPINGQPHLGNLPCPPTRRLRTSLPGCGRQPRPKRIQPLRSTTILTPWLATEASTPIRLTARLGPRPPICTAI